MTLFLILKGEWFDMIASGEKKEEYREIKPFWTKRLIGKNYENIIFQHGYSKNARKMRVEFKGVCEKVPVAEWSNNSKEISYAISLGEVQLL